MALAMAIMKIVLALITVFGNIFDHHIWSLYGQVFKAVVNICWKNNFLFHFQSSLQGPNFLHISVGFHLKDFCQFFGLQSKPITRFFLWAWHNFWQHNCFSLFITFCWLILFYVSVFDWKDFWLILWPSFKILRSTLPHFFAVLSLETRIETKWHKFHI